jgi:hypothetical protein
MEAMYEVTLGDVTKVAPFSQAMAVAESMVAEAGGVGVPTLTRLPMGPVGTALAPTVAPVATAATVAAIAAAPALERGVTIVADGLSRSESDRAAAEAAGYATAETVYARGTAVIDVGVENARESYNEWLAMPRTVDACEALVRRVEAEDRRDIETPSRDAMGLISTHSLSTRAVKSLCTRIGSGGGAYLAAECSDELLRLNLAEQLANKGPQGLSFRTRARVDGTREIFGVTSPKYASFDADRLAGQVASCVPPDARGHVSYDGYRTRVEALLQTNVQPENFVAGEFFRAGVVVTGEDTGGGSINVMGMVLQNLCLNLLILDESWQKFGRFVHKGNRADQGLAIRVERAIRAAAQSLEHFRERWGYAARTDAIVDGGDTLMREVAMASIFRGILDRELVKLPGRVEDRVPQLVQAWKLDDSSATATVTTSKAAVVNAFTRLAHSDGGLDAWTQDGVSRDAANLLHIDGAFPMAEAA